MECLPAVSLCPFFFVAKLGSSAKSTLGIYNSAVFSLELILARSALSDWSGFCRGFLSLAVKIIWPGEQIDR